MSQDAANSTRVVIGSELPRCPYCGADVKKMLGYRNCPQCNGYICMGRRPDDGETVLVTEDEALRLDEAWSISRGYHDRWLQERLVYEAEAARQAEQLGRQPSDTEINRSLLSRHASEALAEMQLGIYTSWLYKLAELEKRDEKFDRAIDLSLRVCFLDANGPVNGPDFEGRVFDSKTALRRPLAAACIVAESEIRLGLNQQSIEQRYMRVAGSVREEFKTPRTVKGVWNDNVQGAMRAAWKDAEEWLFGKPD